MAALPLEGAPQGAAATAPGGDFAAALLLAATAAPTTDGSLDAALDALLPAGEQFAEGEADEGSGQDALAAAFAALPELLAKLDLAPAPAGTAEQSQAIAGLAGSVAAGDGLAAELVDAAADLAPEEDQAAPAASTDTGPVENVAPEIAQPTDLAAAPDIPVVTTEPAATIANNQPTAIERAHAEALFEASDATAPPEATSEPPQPSGGGATESPPAIDNTDSVVRFAGNAGQQQNTGGDPDRRGNSQPDQLPNASVQGVAHANSRSAVAEAATPAAGTTSAATAETEAQFPPAVQQVRQAVIERVEAGGGEAVIRLDPPELGSVNIHVRITGEAVHVTVEADQSSAAQLLRQHAQDLSNLLGSHGLNLADVNVGLGNGQANDPNASGHQQQGRGRANPGEFASIFDAGAPEATARHNRLRAAYNPDGSHIYRV
ncbi:MAG: flagellar hook-length control protein FliK [Dehalococcoidia bacterium]|nr:flagellar hook-length control protein FliK [Dehalococcoidia bacterium]